MQFHCIISPFHVRFHSFIPINPDFCLGLLGPEGGGEISPNYETMTDYATVKSYLSELFQSPFAPWNSHLIYVLLGHNQLKNYISLLISFSIKLSNNSVRGIQNPVRWKGQCGLCHTNAPAG